MQRNWTRKLYKVERSLLLWQYEPFCDFSESYEAIRSIQLTDHWKSYFSELVEINTQKAKDWNTGGGVQHEGMRKLRGKKVGFSILYPLGCSSFGFTLHEMMHCFGKWREYHDDEYMYHWLTMWHLFAPKVYFDIITDALDDEGVPWKELMAWR